MRIRFRLLTTFAFSLLVVGMARATTFTVSNTNDAGTGSLRAAIISANADNTATPGSPHIINATGIIGTISLQSALPDIVNHVTINGPVASSLTITRGVAAPFRILRVNGTYTVAIVRVIITNGSSIAGGGVANSGGTVTLTNCTISGNTSTNAGGGILNAGGEMTLTNCTISDNSATNNGGGISNGGDFGTSAEMFLTNCTISDNTADDHSGGGIEIFGGEMTLSGCTISGNSAGEHGGGIATRIAPLIPGATLTMTNCTISDNSATDNGGGISGEEVTLTMTSCTVTGNTAGNVGGGIMTLFGEVELTGCTVSDNTGSGIHNSLGTMELTGCTVSGNTGSGVANSGGFAGTAEMTMSTCTVSGNTGSGISNSGTLTMSTCTVSSNTSSIDGGGVANEGGTVTMSNCTLSDNSATRHGGGILITEFAGITLTDCTLSDNSATEKGGGIYNNGRVTLTNSTVSDNSSADDGGAIYMTGFARTELTNSTISGNNASSDGGGIFNLVGTLTLINCTIFGNSATSFGGGIHNSYEATITNCTISGNSASFGGGIYNTVTFSGPAPLSLLNTIISGNTAASGPDLNGTANSSGHNLIGNTSGSTGWVASDLQGVDPELGSLQNNGGSTETMAIGCGSPAVDAGDNTDAPDTDQRGEPRIVDGDCDGVATIDIGAFEFQGTPPPTIILTSSAIELSPPNHNYQTVRVTDFVSDVTDAAGACTTFAPGDVLITEVTSDEPENASGGGDGNTVNDISIASNCKSVQLRAERDGGGNGRVYRIHVAVGCGNETTASFKVSVRKGNGAAVEGSVAYSETSSCTLGPKQVVQVPDAQYGFSLMENYPNPFNTSTVIGYSIGTSDHVRLTVFDIGGRVVAALVDEVQSAGEYSLLFNGSELPAGTYYYVLESNGERLIGSMILSK
jgi:parallel beta-helix repeat protein/predicted outer membrane repeat protein